MTGAVHPGKPRTLSNASTEKTTSIKKKGNIRLSLLLTYEEKWKYSHIRTNGDV